jgi:H+/Cl- antiporter ClcA
MRRRVKLVLYTAAAFGAFGGIALFTGIFGGSGGLPRFDAITATYADLLWVVPCILLAWLMVLLYHASNSFFGDISRRLGEGPTATIVKPVVAGLVMGAVAMAFPLALFPGEEQSRVLMEGWEAWTVLMLLGTGLFKCILTPMCIRMGWMGGSFFPSIFAGVACGYGLAALTGADPMLMVTVTATAYLAGVTRQPLLTVAILALCFPLTGILWSGLAAVIGGTLPVPRTWLREDE